MRSQFFKKTDSLWFLNDDGKLIICAPLADSEQGFIAFISLEEGTIFLADSDWDKSLMAAKLTLKQLWSVESMPVHVLTPTTRGQVAVQTLIKEAFCGRTSR
jgi:hypothetical protein